MIRWWAAFWLPLALPFVYLKAYIELSTGAVI